MATELQWRIAALLKDRTRREIRERAKAGGKPSHLEIAEDYGVPVEFVDVVASWQMFEDDSQPGSSSLDAGLRAKLEGLIAARVHLACPRCADFRPDQIGMEGLWHCTACGHEFTTPQRWIKADELSTLLVSDQETKTTTDGGQ